MSPKEWNWMTVVERTAWLAARMYRGMEPLISVMAAFPWERLTTLAKGTIMDLADEDPR